MRRILRIALLALIAVVAYGDDSSLVLGPDALIWGGSTDISTTDTFTFGEYGDRSWAAIASPGSSPSIFSEISDSEGRSLREKLQLITDLAARLEKAQQAHDQELRLLGAAKFPGQFGLAGRLSITKDFRRIEWSTAPNCNPRRGYPSITYQHRTVPADFTTTLLDYGTTTSAAQWTQ